MAKDENQEIITTQPIKWDVVELLIGRELIGRAVRKDKYSEWELKPLDVVGLWSTGRLQQVIEVLGQLNLEITP